MKNVQEFKVAVIETFKKHFPNGYAKIENMKFESGFYLSFGLIGDVKDQIHNAVENDPMQLLFSVYCKLDNDQFVGKPILEKIYSWLGVLPDSPDYTVVNVDFSPIDPSDDTPEDLIRSLEKHFIEMKKVVISERNNNNITGQKEIPLKYLEL